MRKIPCLGDSPRSHRLEEQYRSRVGEDDLNENLAPTTKPRAKASWEKTGRIALRAAVVVGDGAIAETLGPRELDVVIAEHGEHVVAHEQDPHAIDMNVNVTAGRAA